MNKGALIMKGYICGMLSGIAVGAAVGMFCTPGASRNARSVRRNTDHAVRELERTLERLRG